MPGPGEYAKLRKRLVQDIQQERPAFEDRINPRDFFRIFIAEPRRSTERVVAQDGAFLVSAFHDRFEPAEILSRTHELPEYELQTLKIPAGSKQSILNSLAMLSITEESMFPGLDTAARVVFEESGL